MVEKFFQIGASCFRSVSTERIQKKNRDGTALTAEPTSARNGLLGPETETAERPSVTRSAG